MLNAFIFGFILAFGLIIPLGIQNIFIFNQGATQRHFLHALPAVLTAFICDGLLVTVAVLGVSAIVFTVPWIKTLLFGIGICFLSYMGWSTWKNSPGKLSTNTAPHSVKEQIVFAATVSLLNPHAILDTIGVIGTNSLEFDGAEKIAFTVACYIVAFMWFFGLSVAGHFLQRVDKSGHWLAVINKISAVIIWIVAGYLTVQLFNHLQLI